MQTLFWVLGGQVIFAVIVIVVLKKLLEKELMHAALEKFETCKLSEASQVITITSASAISEDLKGYFQTIQKRRMPQAILNFEQNASLKGGVMISAGDMVLDFSLSNRLEHFWS